MSEFDLFLATGNGDAELAELFAEVDATMQRFDAKLAQLDEALPSLRDLYAEFDVFVAARPYLSE